jgi:hypothetical protein
MWNPNIPQLYSLPRPVTGIALLFTQINVFGSDCWTYNRAEISRVEIK